MEIFGKELAMEKAEGEVENPASWATGIIKVACILVIGVVILNGVVDTSTIDANSTFYELFNNVTNNIESGYTLAALMILALGAAAIMRFLGFM